MSSLPCFAPSIIGRLPQGARGSRGSDFKRRRRRYSPFSAFKSSIASVRASARGEALGDDLGQVAGTSLDKGVELDALAKMDLVSACLAAHCPTTTTPDDRLGVAISSAGLYLWLIDFRPADLDLLWKQSR